MSDAAYATIKRALQNLINEFPEVKTVVSRIGVAEIPTDPMPMDIADSYIILEKDKSKWTSADSKEELIEKENTINTTSENNTEYAKQNFQYYIKFYLLNEIHELRMDPITFYLLHLSKFAIMY